MKELTILHLYPKEMNLYGDMGNITTLKKRAEWRGVVVNVLDHDPGDRFPKSVDIIFGGGGQDSGQSKIHNDLLKNKENISNLIENETPCLVICGLYQLFGHKFTTASGDTLEGISIFDIETFGKAKRLIGNTVEKSDKFGEIVGYENHSGQTFLGKKATPLAYVVSGDGNNQADETEGVIYKNAIGTYLHGPILPKNVKVADFLIKTALDRKYGAEKLKKLDDSLENKAHNLAKTRPR